MSDFFDLVLKDNFMNNLPAMRFSPRIDIKEDEKTYHVTAEIPGMKEEDIHLTVKDNYLVLEGEKRNEIKKEEKGMIRNEISYGSFYRSVPFSKEINSEKVAAVYKDGILNIDIEKMTPETGKGRKISIQRA